MHRYRFEAFVIAAAVLAAACSDTPSENSDPPVPGIRVLNATPDTVEADVDGTGTVTLLPSVVSPNFDVPAGAHTVVISRNDDGVIRTASAIIASTETSRSIVFAYSGDANEIAASVLGDTGSMVPAGKSKLRVIHLVPDAQPLDIWRTQPDFQTPVRILFPFTYSPEPYSYIQSDAGIWHVWITPEGNPADTIHSTGAIDIPSGQRRTVALVDSSGVLRLRVLEE
jgi:hypothetical protein